MSRWVYCHRCGCTGYHREPGSARECPCPNGCEGGRAYGDTHTVWFNRLVANRVQVDEGGRAAADPGQPGSGNVSGRAQALRP